LHAYSPCTTQNDMLRHEIARHASREVVDARVAADMRLRGLDECQNVLYTQTRSAGARAIPMMGSGREKRGGRVVRCIPRPVLKMAEVQTGALPNRIEPEAWMGGHDLIALCFYHWPSPLSEMLL
jgi:hypothetical protein